MRDEVVTNAGYGCAAGAVGGASAGMAGGPFGIAAGAVAGCLFGASMEQLPLTPTQTK